MRGIASTTDRINQLIERLSAFRGTVQLNTSLLDLSAMVRTTVASLHQLRDVTVLQELCLSAPIRGDEDQLRSVLTNLLLNAREALATGGEIRVATQQQNGHVSLIVGDNGCGMTPAFLQQELFRPFRTTKRKGLGIGMFHSKMIVGAHHGTLHVKSAPGEGTVFQIVLPGSANA
jgi:hypothetical protein